MEFLQTLQKLFPVPRPCCADSFPVTLEAQVGQRDTLVPNFNWDSFLLVFRTQESAQHSVNAARCSHLAIKSRPKRFRQYAECSSDAIKVHPFIVFMKHFSNSLSILLGGVLGCLLQR